MHLSEHEEWLAAEEARKADAHRHVQPAHEAEEDERKKRTENENQKKDEDDRYWIQFGG